MKCPLFPFKNNHAPVMVNFSNDFKQAHSYVREVDKVKNMQAAKHNMLRMLLEDNAKRKKIVKSFQISNGCPKLPPPPKIRPCLLSFTFCEETKAPISTNAMQCNAIQSRLSWDICWDFLFSNMSDWSHILCRRLRLLLDQGFCGF